ncbi:MAG: penicillin acylase family protein, partial [Gemmatimonadetes bacterium]|nr:penicillin acylase family protein [Gemmatimonadota bacterium]
MCVDRGRFPGLGIIVLTLLATACGAAPPSTLGELAAQSLARIEGELAVSGLKQPVEVIRDEWGIPHIYAQNDDDLFFAQGYVMAQDRLWQMEMWCRWHEGRLAEIFGPAAFDFDVRTRLLMFRGPWDAAEWTSYHPDAERLFTAYANGVNAFIEQNADNLPVEFKLTGLTPDPWTAQTIVLRWAQLGLASVRGHALEEIQLAQNVARLGVAEANRRTAPDPWDDLEIPEGLDVSILPADILDVMRAGDGDPFEPGVLPPLEIVEAYRSLVQGVRVAQVAPEFQDPEGSNNWVVSGRLSTTGIPILANDPHRRIEMPALRYFVHLVAPGWNVIGGGEPPFLGVEAGNNERMAWGFTFAGTDMVDVFVEETHPADRNQTLYNGAWEPLRSVREEIEVKGEAPRTVEMKFSRHGPVFYEDTIHHRAYAVKSVNQEPGTAPYLGSFKLAQAPSCSDFFERAMFWKVPTHNLICGDVDGNIALQVTGLTPDRDGWNGRLPVPGTGKYEWRGFRADLPREFNPARGYIVTANDNTHPADYTGRPVFYHSTRGVDIARSTRLHQLLGTGSKFSVQDHQRFQQDAYSLQAERDHPLFHGWTSQDVDVERARALIERWDLVLTKESVPGAIYVRWTTVAESAALDPATPATRRQALVEDGFRRALEQARQAWGADWSQWRYGRINQSELPHQFVRAFDLQPVERPGGFNTVNATGANFRRIIDLSNLDNSVASNAPGQSAQPGSPFYGNLREYLGSGEYFPMAFTRGAVDE